MAECVKGTPRERRQRWQKEVGPVYLFHIVRSTCGTKDCILPEHCEIIDQRKNPFKKHIKRL